MAVSGVPRTSGSEQVSRRDHAQREAEMHGFILWHVILPVFL